MNRPSTNYNSMMNQSPNHAILVLGKAGNGKSAVCNTLLGQEKFAEGRGLSTSTTTAGYADRDYLDMSIRVIDTPDITNCGMTNVERQAEVRKWKSLLAVPSPSLVLLTVRCDVRYTSEEYDIFQEMCRLWGGSDLTDNLIVAFTFGDRQDYSIEQDVNNPPPELSHILKRAKKRHLLFINKDNVDRTAQAKKCFAMLPRRMKWSEDIGDNSCPGGCAIL